MLTGSAISELQSFVVEGTSFNPNLGGVVGMKTLTKNCEVEVSLIHLLARWISQHPPCSRSQNHRFDFQMSISTVSWGLTLHAWYTDLLLTLSVQANHILYLSFLVSLQCNYIMVICCMCNENQHMIHHCTIMTSDFLVILVPYEQQP